MVVTLPKRVVFNFAERCNMQCPFCYIPFDGQMGNEKTARRIIEKLSKWKLLNITFGGGDPLMYSYFCDLVDYARREMGKNTLIQVDTNGLRLDADKLKRLATSVDVIGLPLETTSPTIAAKMRGRGSHPVLITRLLGRLSQQGVPIKVNTVVTTDNLNDLSEVGVLLSNYYIRLWSLYQFWPIDSSPSIAESNASVNDYDFMNATTELMSSFPKLPVEIGLTSERAATYFFVTQTGRAYSISLGQSEKRHEYVELGSVFDDESIRQWTCLGDPAANAMRAKKRTAALGMSS